MQRGHPEDWPDDRVVAPIAREAVTGNASSAKVGAGRAAAGTDERQGDTLLGRAVAHDTAASRIASGMSKFA
jgi:hypothetical protein